MCFRFPWDISLPARSLAPASVSFPGPNIASPLSTRPQARRSLTNSSHLLLRLHRESPRSTGSPGACMIRLRETSKTRIPPESFFCSHLNCCCSQVLYRPPCQFRHYRQTFASSHELLNQRLLTGQS